MQTSVKGSKNRMPWACFYYSRDLSTYQKPKGIYYYILHVRILSSVGLFHFLELFNVMLTRYIQKHASKEYGAY